MHLYEKKRRHSRGRDLFLSVLMLLTVVVLVVNILGNTSATATAHEEEMIRQAVLRAAVTCYTLEGKYPEDLQYLIDNYGLILNTDDFIVSYTAVADNMMPDIFVAAKPSR